MDINREWLRTFISIFVLCEYVIFFMDLIRFVKRLLHNIKVYSQHDIVVFWYFYMVKLEFYSTKLFFVVIDYQCVDGL